MKWGKLPDSGLFRTAEQGEMLRPFLILAFSLIAIVAILYNTKDSPDNLPANAPATVFVPQSVTPAEQKAAVAGIAALKCPEAYANDVERAKAFYEYFDYFFTVYPNKHGMYDWDAGRMDFLISHHCTTTLVAYGYDGTSPIDSAIRQKLINNAMQSDQATSTP